MNTTLAYLRGRRAWLVENLTVWGSAGETNLVMAAVETIDAQKRIGFWRVNLGQDCQEVNFADLVDNRGNHLPETIMKPAVIIIPKGPGGAFIKAVQGETGFTIAKSDGDGPSVDVDVMVLETGL